MTTSSTSSLLPANSPTTNLPPATSTTSHLLLATSTTSHLPPATSSTSHLLPSTSTVVRSLRFLCRHVFCVLKNCNIEVIPERYILRRWRREKSKQNLVNNLQKASNKGGRRGERRKSEREIAMKDKAKRARKCGYCAEKTNKHTKTTCPLNPKYIAKLARTEAAAEQERRTAASATEQEERNSDTTHIADKEQSNTAS
ncbi:hypothetical protein Tco_0660731 [Tanacetum coccineum]